MTRSMTIARDHPVNLENLFLVDRRERTEVELPRHKKTTLRDILSVFSSWLVSLSLSPPPLPPLLSRTSFLWLWKLLWVTSEVTSHEIDTCEQGTYPLCPRSNFYLLVQGYFAGGVARDAPLMLEDTQRFNIHAVFKRERRSRFPSSSDIRLFFFLFCSFSLIENQNSMKFRDIA